MMIQQYPDMLEYAIEKQKQNPGAFLHYFLYACLQADAENFEILAPALQQIMVKYPVREYPHSAKDEMEEISAEESNDAKAE